MAISDNELIYLCSPSYGYPPVGSYIRTPEGSSFKVIDTYYCGDNDNKCGLDAVIVEKQPGGEKAMVFVGSDQLLDWYNDFLLTHPEQIPEQFITALSYYQGKCKEYGIQMPVTGNSLGGGLANYVAVHNPGTISVTLNPAMLPEADKSFDQVNANHNITNYIDKGEILHKVQEASGGMIPGNIVEFETGIDSPYRIGDLHTGRHENGVNSSSFISRNLFTGNTYVEGENVRIDQESFKIFFEQMERIFKEIESNCFLLTEQNISSATNVAANRPNRENVIANESCMFLADNFLTISQMLNEKFDLNIVINSPAYILPSYGVAPATEIPGKTYIDIFETIGEKINVSSGLLWHWLDGRIPSARLIISDLNGKLNPLYSNLSNLINTIIANVLDGMKATESRPALDPAIQDIVDLSRFIQKEIIIVAQNILRLGFMARCIADSFTTADESGNLFRQDDINTSSWEHAQEIFNSSEIRQKIGQNGFENMPQMESSEAIGFEDVFTTKDLNDLNTKAANLKKFKTEIVDTKFEEAYTNSQKDITNVLERSLEPICADIDSLVKQFNNIREANDTYDICLYISYFERCQLGMDNPRFYVHETRHGVSLDNSMPDMRYVSLNIFLRETKQIDLDLLLNTLLLANNDVRNNIHNVGILVESLKETFKNMIFYPDELESINNNNAISYNTLKTLLIELKNAKNQLQDFNTSKAIREFIQRIDYEIANVEQLSYYIETITTMK